MLIISSKSLILNAFSVQSVVQFFTGILLNDTMHFELLVPPSLHLTSAGNQAKTLLDLEMPPKSMVFVSFTNLSEEEFDIERIFKLNTLRQCTKSEADAISSEWLAPIFLFSFSNTCEKQLYFGIQFVWCLATPNPNTYSWSRVQLQKGVWDHPQNVFRLDLFQKFLLVLCLLTVLRLIYLEYR